MTNEQMREDFEAECRRYWGERCPDLTFVDGKYENNGRADLAWKFWQAATAKANPWRPIADAPQSSIELLALSQMGLVSVETGWALLNMLADAKDNGKKCMYKGWLPLPPTGTGGNV